MDTADTADTVADTADTPADTTISTTTLCAYGTCDLHTP